MLALSSHVVCVISIHAPLAGCDVAALSVKPVRKIFQSTHPLRGATICESITRYTISISIHAPLAGCDGHRGDRHAG